MAGKEPFLRRFIPIARQPTPMLFLVKCRDFWNEWSPILCGGGRYPLGEKSNPDESHNAEN